MCVGSHYTNVYSSWTSFAWRIAPLLSKARLHIFTAIKYVGHLTAKLEVSFAITRLSAAAYGCAIMLHGLDAAGKFRKH